MSLIKPAIMTFNRVHLEESISTVNETFPILFKVLKLGINLSKKFSDLIHVNQINITRKNIKNIYIRVVPPDGDIKVSAPMHISDEEINNFIDANSEWILKKQKSILENNKKIPIKYKTGDAVYLWGNKYTLELINAGSSHVLDSKLFLKVPKRNSLEKRVNALNEFYRKELNNKIPQILEKCTRIVGEKPNEIRIRKMKNWGNCRMPGRIITLNLKLASKREECLEYVMIHELCHLIEFNHSKRFKTLMNKFCPNWQELKKELNRSD